MTPIALDIKNLSKSFMGVKANDHVTIQVYEGEIHALIGPNGAGKTTAISMISGELKPDEGSIFLYDEDVTNMPAWKRIHAGMARTYQISRFFPKMTVKENIQISLQIQNGHSFGFWQKAFGQHNAKAHDILNIFELDGFAHMRAEELPHGVRRVLELAVVMARKPKFLLLDEPMAGMSKEASEKLTNLLDNARKSTTMLLVEHDMDVVFKLADRITVLVQGSVLKTGTTSEIAHDEHVRRAYFGQDIK